MGGMDKVVDVGTVKGGKENISTLELFGKLGG